MSVLAFGAVFGIALVNGSSMSPAINAGDCLLFVRRGEYRRGDIVLFCRAGDLEDEYIKRIIALPGERVDISADGIVLINGAAIDEPYASGQTIGDGSVQFPLLLGADEYFVLGDNREVSHDSRRIGAVARGSLLGRVVIVLRLSGKQN
ncbi:MAG: signal peptidase I [Clostridium sp.]|nr:signal peptidase I [Clostridium sp.]